MKSRPTSFALRAIRHQNICLRASPALLDTLELALDNWNSRSLSEPISRSAFVRLLLAERLDLTPGDLHPVATYGPKETIMTDQRLGLSASKSELPLSPADRKLLQKRQQAGLAHSAVAALNYGATPPKGAAVGQAFAAQLRDQVPTQVRKDEKANLDPSIVRLRLSADGGLLLTALKSEIERNSGRPVGVVADRAGEVLGIGPTRAARAKEELVHRGLIRPVVNSLGGPDGYRVIMPFGA